MSDLSCPRCDGTGVIPAEDWTAADEKADQKPAATETATSEQDAIWDAVIAWNDEQSSLVVDKKQAFLSSLASAGYVIAAAPPPSGQVCVDTGAE